MSHPLFKHCCNLQKPYSILLWVALTALVVLQLSHYRYTWQQQQLAANIASQYGERIAKLTADQVVSKLLNHDAISLQTTAQSISTKSVATSVVIYDINHDILAQANNSQKPETLDTHHYTSPVVSNNNIIGSVTIGVSPSSLVNDSSDSITLIISFLLLLAMVVIYSKGKGPSAANEADTKDTPEIAPQVALAEESDTQYPTLLTLHIQNTDKLYQQLNAELRSQQFNALEHIISHTMQLYGAEKQWVGHDSITLSFTNERDVCNAVFTGELILRLNQTSADSIISLNGLIQTQADGENFLCTLDSAKKCLGNKSKQHCLFISKHLSTQNDLHTKVIFADSPSTKMVEVSDLKGNYKVLLNKQLSQLQNNATI